MSIERSSIGRIPQKIRPKFIRYFKISSVFFYFFLITWVLIQHGPYLILTPIQSLLYFLAAWLLSDFITGVFHWIFDTWGKHSWPVLGQLFVRPFLEHDTNPEGIVHYDWIETNGSNLFVVSLFLSVAMLIEVSPALISLLLFLNLWGGWTGQFHKWSHQTKVPKWVALLQKYGIILSRENHHRHHEGEFTQHYCITSGFLNSFLDQIALFRFFEWSIQKMIGNKPRDNELP